MEKFISYEKMSKSQKRKRDLQGRTLWTRSPVTRIKNNDKIYNRRKEKVYLQKEWKD